MRGSHGVESGLKKVLALEEAEREREGALWAERSRHSVAWPLAYNVDAT